MRLAFVPILFFAATAVAQPFRVEGYVAGRALHATGPASWLEGGTGRLEATGDRDDLMAVTQLGIDWEPSSFFRVHVSGTARQDPAEFRGDGAGLVEAYVDLHRELGLDDVQLRAGMLFLPTSRENTDPLWASPYTIHFSALNTWIGQEVRPIGVDLQYRHTTRLGHRITGGATAFQGNDTMGTLLAWRGWSVGSRLSTYEEVLPLPPLPSLQNDGAFFRQRDDGSIPFERDLDGKTGYAGRLRYAIPQRASVQYAYVDNRGDRRLYRGEYAWDTKFHLVSAEVGNPDTLVVAGEWMRGRTAMGLFDPFVDADFDAAYLLTSYKRGRNRWTARYERFGTDDRDGTAAERNDEDLRSWTLAWLFDLTDTLRLGAEFTQVSGQRAETEDPYARSITFEARYHF